MKVQVKDFKREIFYVLVIFFISFFFNYFSYTTEKVLLFSIGGLGLMIIETWFIGAVLRYSGKKISQYSEVIQRVKIGIDSLLISFFPRFYIVLHYIYLLHSNLFCRSYGVDSNLYYILCFVCKCKKFLQESIFSRTGNKNSF
jgi:hypothetical protein